MKNTIKSVMAMALALVLTASSLGGTAFAEPSSTTKIDGYTVRASVSWKGGSAQAITSIEGVSSGYASATVYVYYWFDDNNYYSVASKDSTYGSATAVASKKTGGADVIGAKGEHLASLNGTTRPLFTSVDKTPSDAIKK